MIMLDTQIGVRQDLIRNMKKRQEWDFAPVIKLKQNLVKVKIIQDEKIGLDLIDMVIVDAEIGMRQNPH